MLPPNSPPMVPAVPGNNPSAAPATHALFSENIFSGHHLAAAHVGISLQLPTAGKVALLVNILHSHAALNQREAPLLQNDQSNEARGAGQAQTIDGLRGVILRPNQRKRAHGSLTLFDIFCTARTAALNFATALTLFYALRMSAGNHCNRCCN